ncbi:MAG: hypothetical protein MJ070_10150, partial [Lachnospiraceae bacterium]|nr:hypothetical protein [Lachnospiraceae bacterium]
STIGGSFFQCPFLTDLFRISSAFYILQLEKARKNHAFSGVSMSCNFDTKKNKKSEKPHKIRLFGQMKTGRSTKNDRPVIMT